VKPGLSPSGTEGSCNRQVTVAAPFFSCDVISFLLLAVVVKLEPSSAWSQSLFLPGFRLLVIRSSLTDCLCPYSDGSRL
jgi:hypothetical protein